MAQILVKAYLCYPNLKLAKEVVASWWDLFKDADPHKFNSALMEASKQKESGFFPAPGEVQAVINKQQLSKKIEEGHYRQLEDDNEKNKKISEYLNTQRTPLELESAAFWFGKINEAIAEGKARLNKKLELKISQGGFRRG